MTRYIGGCFCCGEQEGNFVGSLPNGVCVHPGLAGAYFCDACCDKIEKSSNLLKDQIERWKGTGEGFGYITYILFKIRGLIRELMDFEEIAKTCPWQTEDTVFNKKECGAVYPRICNRENCAFWHWMFHLSVIGADREAEEEG